MIYYIADMHFGHKNVLRFDNRPFADTELMDEVLIHNWNERVTDEDGASATKRWLSRGSSKTGKHPHSFGEWAIGQERM